ncbi:MAG: hypothetical protein BWY63_03060 [Chloroflexi bacterium ADurb.Bin360]|nr:MAG: hypothetical protein BWY63_03060 [Chloroflexi bacterium ADurb.Bin360]
MGPGTVLVELAVVVAVIAYVAHPFRRDSPDPDALIEAWVAREARALQLGAPALALIGSAANRDALGELGLGLFALALALLWTYWLWRPIPVPPAPAALCPQIRALAALDAAFAAGELDATAHAQQRVALKEALREALDTLEPTSWQ